MKILVAGLDSNALVAALLLKEQGHEVEMVAADDVSALLPASPIAPEVATRFDLGVTLQIVGRVGVSPSGETVNLKLREISGSVSERDRERWSGFANVLNNGSELWRSLFTGEDVTARWRGFGRRQAMEVLRVPFQSLAELLDDWFETDLLKATLAAAALRGSRQGPFSPGSAFLLLQRWARGGLFGRSRLRPESLRERAAQAGILIHDRRLRGFEVARGKVAGLETDDGTTLHADLYVTSEDLVSTLSRRVGLGKLEPDKVKMVEQWDTRSTTVVVRLKGEDRWNGATVNFCSDLASLERAYDATKYGADSEVPFGELDPGEGLLYLQHLGGGESVAEKVEAFCRSQRLGEVERILTPTDIEAEFGASGGHLTGGERSLWQSYELRERLRNPLPNLYLCGASTGPGDYSGISGQMAAALCQDGPRRHPQSVYSL